MEAEKLVAFAHRFGRPAEAILPVERALEVALQRAEQEEAAVLAAGSLFIAAAVRSAWNVLYERKQVE
jgi:folylpolyglutamate synthase/dihydropteroate synthase